MFLFRKNKKKEKLSDKLYANPAGETHQQTNAQPFFRNISNAISLQDMRRFWKKNLNYYQESFKNASTDEYLTYGKTLMLCGFKNATPLKTKFPVYMERECHISNPAKMQQNLLFDSYIEPAPLYEILASYKLADLKIIADSVGCSKNGNKADLIQRIRENIDEDMEYSIVSNSNLYSLSDIGTSFLTANYDYVELHRHQSYDISLYEFNKNRVLDGRRKRTFNDNVYTLISERIYRKSVHRNYYMLDYDYHILYEIALTEHFYDIAITHYLRYLYLKSCCVRTAQYYATNYPHSDFNENNEVIFTVQSASPIVDLSNFYNILYIKDMYIDQTLPPSFLTEYEFTNMVDEMISDTSFDYAKYNNLIISRLKKYSKL